jgi:hypothetical protein
MSEMVKSSETKLFADASLLFRTINNQADSVFLLRNILIYVEGVGVALCRTLLQSLAR